MTGIRMGRVIAGGLVAGLIINISEAILNVPVIGSQLEEALKARNLPAIGGGAIGFFVAISFLLGILVVWMYAAMRPRFGPGPKTAIKVAVLAWFLTYFWSTSSMVVIGFMPAGLSAFGLAWGLVELIVATLVAAKIYTEPAT